MIPWKSKFVADHEPPKHGTSQAAEQESLPRARQKFAIVVTQELYGDQLEALKKEGVEESASNAKKS